MNDTNPIPVLVMFGLICFLVLTAFVRHQRRENWSLVRGLVGLVGVSFPARPVSTVSAPQPAAESFETTVEQLVMQPQVMSYTRRRAIKRRHLDGVRRAYSAAKLENRKLKTENLKLRQALEEATQGQRKAIRVYLDRSAAKKPLTRSNVAALLGRDKTAALRLIGEVEAEMEQEARLAAPVPPEIARPEPLPV